jgi:hypothetical protein
MGPALLILAVADVPRAGRFYTTGPGLVPCVTTPVSVETTDGIGLAGATALHADVDVLDDTRYGPHARACTRLFGAFVRIQSMGGKEFRGGPTWALGTLPTSTLPSAWVTCTAPVESRSIARQPEWAARWCVLQRTTRFHIPCLPPRAHSQT